ncbi:MAG: class I SAM-dependent methyltransferase [Magnetococcus sp. YQC-5]
MERLNRIVVDSSDSMTDLCVLGAQYPTDKSPYNWAPEREVARHPYTAIYDLLFSALRYQPIVLGEVGVYLNMSMHMWRAYFPNAQLYGWDFLPEILDLAKGHRLHNCYYDKLNMNDIEGVFQAFNKCNTYFDVLIDDSTHAFAHQILFAHMAYPFLKPGGMLIIEDVFRPWDEKNYEDTLRPLFKYFSSGTFIEANHRNKFSPGTEIPYYDNDKLLVLFRNQEPAGINPPLVPNPPLIAQALADRR